MQNLTNKEIDEIAGAGLAANLINSVIEQPIQNVSYEAGRFAGSVTRNTALGAVSVSGKALEFVIDNVKNII